MSYTEEQEKSRASKVQREEHIAVALRMVKKGGYSIDQIMEASTLSRNEVQGLIDNTHRKN